MKWQNLSIVKDAASEVLRIRWIACYMLYDWNCHHAGYAFECNEPDRIKKVCDKLGDDYVLSADICTKITQIYNKVLLHDVEDFIRIHMEVRNEDRVDVEFAIVRAIASMVNTS